MCFHDTPLPTKGLGDVFLLAASVFVLAVGSRHHCLRKQHRK